MLHDSKFDDKYTALRLNKYRGEECFIIVLKGFLDPSRKN